MAPEDLPEDAEFKGYVENVVQEMVLQKEVIRFKREKYWSPSKKETYTAPLPKGYEGQFGPNLTALMIVLCFGCNVSDKKILEFLKFLGVSISKGTVVSKLTDENGEFHEEAKQIIEAGKQSSNYQVFDQTGIRVDGKNYQANILSNPLYTGFRITPGKSRLDVLTAMGNVRDRGYRMDPRAIDYLKNTHISSKASNEVANMLNGENLDEDLFQEFLASNLPELGPQQRRWVKEAGLYAYLKYEGKLPIDILVCDNAREFYHICQRALCWIHEGRHYKKLNPLDSGFQVELEEFRGKFWTYYDKLLSYQRNPDPRTAQRLEEEFDELFSTETGYRHLDERIQKTRENKEQLLRILEHPQIPLHNNAAELGARQIVTKRKISYGPRSESGVRAWESFMTILETSKKLDVSFLTTSKTA